MILSSLAFALIVQTAQTPPDYSVPVGASSEFHHLVIDIETALGAKDFATAKAKTAMLPKNEVTYRFNSANLDSNQKAEFVGTIESAARAWEQISIHQLTFKQVDSDKADIVFSFEPKLNLLAGTNEVAGATWFLATDPTPPMVEAVIGLKRGPKLEPTVAREVFNESLFTFGRYLGLAPNPIFGSAMGRMDSKMPMATEITSPESISVRKILALSAQLRKLATEEQSIELGHPSITIDQKSLAFDRQYQGDEGRAQLLITNKGTAPLELLVRGDCGCITGTVEPVLQPGKSTLLTGVFNTSELVGEVHHNLVLRTNDPDQPVVIIPVSINVDARAEWVFPTSSTIYFDGPQRSYTFYLNSSDKNVFKILQATILGGDISVKYEPFSGEVDDYHTPGKKRMVRGYKVTLDTSRYPTAALFGRAMIMAYIKTDNPKMSVIRGSLYLQRGIVALPESLYLGSPGGITDATMTIMRPGRPFTIKKVTSACPYLSFEVIKDPAVSGEFTIKTVYNGKAPGHRFKSEIVIQTDDPAQPILRIPVLTNGV